MATARVFKSGNSQAVRLPKGYRVAGKQVEIFRRGKDIVLREAQPDMARAFAVLTELPEDFMADGRRDLPPQPRKNL